ncbi:MAG TPA: FG-GAP-like repeat-containing protein, partial [Myxococcota bacterium]|nr:FG-GAP-like repeat-containing protein [Myxococcota bacterium]
VALRIARGAAARFAGGLTPSTIVRANQATLELGRRLSAIGDFDGDGREDLAVADNRSAWILYGGAWPATGTLDGVPHTNITSTRAAEALGHAIAAAGDADGDGFGDLLITAPGTDQGDYTNAGAAYLVYGSPRRQAVAPVQQLTDLLAARHGPPAGAMFYGDESQLNLGQAIAAGDVDGDGYPELAVTSADYLARSGRVHIVRTGPHGVDIEPVRDVPFSYTPVIDGNDDDWVPDTILADTWGDPWMVSWSPTRLSFGFEPANYSALGALYRLVVYLGNGDGQGATQGITVGSQRPALPVRMDIAVVIKANGADPNVYVANPSTGAWTLSTIPLTFARDPNNALELSLPATAIPGDRLDVAGVWIYTGANASVTNGYPSDAVTAGFDADITRWLSLDRSRAEGPAWVTTSPGGSYPSLDDEQSDFWLDLDRDGEGQDGPPMHVCPIHVPIDPATQATLAVTDPELATDCNDLDPTIFFNALDPVGDGIDSDCDGVDGMTRVRPVVTSCVITPGDADTSDDLTAFAAAEAPEGGPVTWAYRWRVDGALQTDVSGPVLPADRTVRGAEIVVECMPRNGNGRGLPVSSTPVEIHNAVPQATLCTMSPNPPIGGIPATGSMAAWDDDGDPITWTVSWQVDGAATSSGPSLDGSHFGVGDQVAIVCTPSDGIDAGPALAPPACTAVSNDRPTIASASVGPAILSAATTLTCDHPAAADVDGDPIAAYAYTWTVNGAVVATTATLPEGAVHRGDVVSCAVAASDPWGTGSPTSAAPRTVENAPPPQPIVSIAPGPEPTLAQDMRCDVVPDGTDEDGDPVTYAISWTFAGAAWTGATATTTLPGDTIRAADSEAGAWRCTVTPSDGFVPGTPGVANATVRLALGGTTPHPIVAGGDTTCSLTQTGQVRCWGYGTNGARATPYTSPVGKVPGDMGNNLTPSDFGPIDVATIVQGATHTCALTTDGKVKCAGAGTTGQLGNGSTNALGDTPDELGAGLPFVNLGATAVVADLVAGDGSTCALMTDGRMKCWGYNHSARLGLGDLNNRGDDPNEMGDALPYVNVGTNRKVVAVALSGTSTCALRDDNKVVCWGASGQGALGYPTPPAPAAIGDAPAEMGDALVAVDVGPGTILDIVGGTGFACVLFKDGRVKCWGSNSFGQLGLESTTHRGDDAGEMGTALPAVNLGTGAKAARLSSGGVVTCAVLQDARVKCWGGGGTASGYYLGYGDNSGRGSVVGTMGDALPSVAIPGGGSVANVSVSVGLARHTCVATTCGAVWCWGNNNSGQLGIGNSTTQRAPITAVDLGTGLYADVDRAPTCP